MIRLRAALVLAAVALIIGLAVYWSSPEPDHPEYGSAPRSSKWPAMRAAHLKQHPRCEVCGARDDVQVHHVQPFNQRPDLELDAENLITLCRRDHLVFGHLGLFRSWNETVRDDVKHWKKRFAERP